MANDLPPKTFLELVQSGQRSIDQVDDFVSEWHKSEDTRALSQALGLSEDEYGRWVEQPDILQVVLASRHWDELSDSQQAFPPQPGQIKLIEERLEHFRQHPEDTNSWDDVKARILSRYEPRV